MAPTKAEIERDIKQLIQGLMSNSDKIALPAYKRLFEAGAPVVPVLEHKLGQVELTRVTRREAMTMVVGLAALLHDLNERVSNEFIERSLSGKCHPALASSLRSIARYTHGDYRRATFAGVAIFEEIAIDARHNATAHVKQWLRDVPPKDLEALSRIYIVATKPTFDFYGTYLPVLRVVCLVWQTRFDFLPSWLLARGLRVFNRRTLYHEIGHHVHDHSELGQDPQQELEADVYASIRLHRRHPIGSRLGSMIGRFKRVVSSRWR